MRAELVTGVAQAREGVVAEKRGAARKGKLAEEPIERRLRHPVGVERQTNHRKLSTVACARRKPQGVPSPRNRERTSPAHARRCSACDRRSGSPEQRAAAARFASGSNTSRNGEWIRARNTAGRMREARARGTSA